MSTAKQDHFLYLYGGDQPWDSSLWVTTDDRVRGGASVSHLQVLNPEHARFWGHLDTSTLGGAGFASQHSLGELSWDLSSYDGVVVSVRGGGREKKRYALTLKDEIPGRRGDGRERAGVSWEAEFEVEGSGERDVVLGWDAFEATYRGRKKGDVKPLNRADIKRVGLMMRSFFGQQDGDFSLDLRSIAAYKTLDQDGSSSSTAQRDVRVDKSHDADDDESDYGDLEKCSVEVRQPASSRSVWKALFCGLL